MDPSKLKVTKSLVECFKESSDDEFPSSDGKVYKTRYDFVVQNLSRDYHSRVEIGAMLKAIKSGDCHYDQIPYLNIHGEKHVDAVIEKATDLLRESHCEISPYEGYLLLMAIQFHDIGNIFGRQDHEINCREIMEKLGDKAGIDRAEKRVIIKIASVHGGIASDGSKDTIKELHDGFLDLMGKKVRKKFLAAILRLSDELADDYSRTTQQNDDIPEESRIYHEYSRSLHSVVVEKDEIRLSYEVPHETTSKEFLKPNGGKNFLIDEIYQRTLKMHSELLYCMRFMRPDFDIKRISVKIIISAKMGLDELEKIEFALKEDGYPSHGNILDLFPYLKDFTGQAIKEKVEQYA